MYGLMIIIGCTLGISFAYFRKSSFSLKKDDILYCAIFAGIGTLIGSKLLYIITIIPNIVSSWDNILENPSLLLSIIPYGFVFYGGLIGALLGILFYTKRYKISTINMAEHLIPSIPLIHSIGRIGCFCAGCCYGIPYAKPIGLEFNNSPVAPHNISLFPVQLLESGLNLILFFILYKFSKKQRPKGTILAFYLISYAAIRFFIEFLRFDYERGFLLGISTSQWISILILAVTIPSSIIFVKRNSHFD